MSEYVARPKPSVEERHARLQQQAEDAAEAVREYMANEARKIANMARLREERLRRSCESSKPEKLRV